jgi:hypothetical protein
MNSMARLVRYGVSECSSAIAAALEACFINQPEAKSPFSSRPELAKSCQGLALS